MSGIGLYIQLLPKQSHKVLAAAYLAAEMNEDRRFISKDVRYVFDTLRIPVPKNVTANIANLTNAELLVRDASSNQLAITPLGREQAMEVLGEHAVAAAQSVEIEKAAEGALLGEAIHPVIPPAFAPPRWRESIARLLERHSFDSNVFCMTRFHDAEGNLPDPVEDTVDVMRAVCNSHGLTLHLASDRILDGELFGNVGAHIWACRYGIGVLEDRVEQGLNYNVVTELGAMLVTGRRCAILKDKTIPTVPTDISGHIYKPVDIANVDQIKAETEKWIANDLGL